ncbi:MAG: hypothetical protein IPP51_16355 [Bacteroidetes bacterium]|nr:hypothetical protein [Bacteroidota bacterium]
MTSVIARTISVFFVLQFLFTGIAVAQSLPEFNSIVNTNDERSTGDKTFREKEDGIYNVLLPEVQASSELRDLNRLIGPTIFRMLILLLHGLQERPE